MNATPRALNSPSALTRARVERAKRSYRQTSTTSSSRLRAASSSFWYRGLLSVVPEAWSTNSPTTAKPRRSAYVVQRLLEGVEPQRHGHCVGVEDLDHMPPLGLGVGADVGPVLVAEAGLLDLVVHQPGSSPFAASRARRRVSPPFRAASRNDSAPLVAADLRPACRLPSGPLVAAAFL